MQNRTLYYLVYDKIFNKYNNRPISISDFKGQILGRHFHIDKYYSYIVMKEMINMGMIKQINNKKIQLVICDFEEELNKTKLAMKLEMF